MGSLRTASCVLPVSCHNCGAVSGGPQARHWWQCHLAESCPILPPGIFIPGPNKRCRANPALPASLQGPCLACSPLCLQVTRCAYAGPGLGPPRAACPSASAHMAALQAPPAHCPACQRSPSLLYLRGDVSLAQLCPKWLSVGMGDARTLWLLGAPRASAAHLGVLRLLALVLPPSLGSAPAPPATRRRTRGWQTTQWLCGLVHVAWIPGYNHGALCASMACNETVGHGQGEPWG